MTQLGSAGRGTTLGRDVAAARGLLRSWWTNVGLVCPVEPNGAVQGERGWVVTNIDLPGDPNANAALVPHAHPDPWAWLAGLADTASGGRSELAEMGQRVQRLWGSGPVPSDAAGWVVRRALVARFEGVAGAPRADVSLRRDQQGACSLLGMVRAGFEDQLSLCRGASTLMTVNRFTPATGPALLTVLDGSSGWQVLTSPASGGVQPSAAAALLTAAALRAPRGCLLVCGTGERPPVEVGGSVTVADAPAPSPRAARAAQSSRSSQLVRAPRSAGSSVAELLERAGFTVTGSLWVADRH